MALTRLYGSTSWSVSLMCARVEAHTKLLVPMVGWESTLEEPVCANDINLCCIASLSFHTKLVYAKQIQNIYLFMLYYKFKLSLKTCLREANVKL